MMDWLVKPRQRVKFEGRYNFQLLLNTQHVDSSSTINITCFTDKNQRAAVPCNYIWFIIKNGLPQQITNFKGCTFICDTSHIGYYVQAHIISNDAEFSGKAIVTFGPVELDVSLKTGILNALSIGKLQLPIYFVSQEQQQKQGTILLYDSQIKLMHSFSEANYAFDYSIIEPQMTPNARQITKATITFNEKYEVQMRRFERKLFSMNELTSSKSSSYMNLTKSNLKLQPQTQSLPKLQIKFLTRQARDSFFFTVKAFIAKRQLKNSAIIRKIENINFQKQEDFSAILQLDNLKGDLIRYDKLYKQAQLQKKKMQDDHARIQKDYIDRNSRAVDMSMNVNYSATTRRDDPLMMNKINKLEENNLQLNMKIIKLNNELDQARGNASVIMKPQMTLSPFSKNKEDDNESLVELLEDLSRYDPQRQIENLQQQKKTLELKLQRSFDKINILENRLSKGNNVISAPASAINFTYKHNQCSSTDYLKIIEKLKADKEDLIRTNLSLYNQNKLLASRLQKEAKIKSENKIQSHLIKIREQNRTTDLLIESRVEHQKTGKLMQQIQSLTSALKSKQFQLQRTIQKCINLQRRVQDAEVQMQMHRKNQDVLNRSQHMSIQMQNYNEQQIKMLKQHNDFLIEENEKLVRACQKYMADAKQNNTLRKEILQLKEKINQLRTNPQTSSFV